MNEALLFFSWVKYTFNRWFFKNRCEVLKIAHSGSRNVHSSQADWQKVDKLPW